MDINNLRDLFVNGLRDLLSAEEQLLKVLPKMAKAASSPALKRAFEEHLKETESHLERLEQVFSLLDVNAKAKKCKAMQGLIAEGAEWMAVDTEPDVMDAGLIASAQRVEHYEMAGYGCVRTYAQLLGETEAVSLLQETLNEEGATDKKLTELAKKINVEANDENGEGNGDVPQKPSRSKTSPKRGAARD